jgi:hypothetical protein
LGLGAMSYECRPSAICSGVISGKEKWDRGIGTNLLLL